MFGSLWLILFKDSTSLKLPYRDIIQQGLGRSLQQTQYSLCKIGDANPADILSIEYA